MTPHDRVFTWGTVIATAVVPTLILLGAPFDEPRFVMGILCGWGLALLAIVPSYILLSRSIRSGDNAQFFQVWGGGTLGRLFLVLVAVVLFATLVDQAPIMSFLLTFFLGYMLLTGLEITMALGGKKSPNGRHA
ncbi:MAG: hypothetical protein P8N09_01730 [Planctomycetota bacterium]|jgi:hypothetical protein|nr:hypothetical protein [Planctomycetota bacterium]